MFVPIHSHPVGRVAKDGDPGPLSVLLPFETFSVDEQPFKLVPLFMDLGLKLLLATPNNFMLRLQPIPPANRPKLLSLNFP
jgi:hypothetical protein